MGMGTGGNGTPRLDCTLAHFAARYRLSPQESKLVALAVREVPNKLSADELGCSVCTIRTYWHRIFAKVGCTSQRDVLARLVRLVTEAPSAVREEITAPDV